MIETIEHHDVREAIDRIARTPDGERLYRYLQHVLQSLPSTFEGGALQAHTGRRTLARDLMALMAEGIDASGRPGTDKPSERSVAFARAVAVPVARARGPARRVSAEPTEPEPGAAEPA